MKRGRVTRGAAAAQRVLRRRIVVEEDDAEEEEEESQSEESEEEEVAIPRKKVARAAKTSAKKKVKQQQRQENEADDDDDDDDEEEEEDNEEGDEDDEEEGDEDDDEEEEAEDATQEDDAPRSRRSSEKKPPVRGQQPPPRALPTKRQARLMDAKNKSLTPTKSRNRIKNLTDEDDDEDEDEDEDEEGEGDGGVDANEDDRAKAGEKETSKPVTGNKKAAVAGKARKQTRNAVVDDSDEGDDDAAATKMEVDKESTHSADEPPAAPSTKSITSKKQFVVTTASVAAAKEERDAEASKSEASSAVPTPASSPVRRKGISMSALMNSPDPPPSSADDVPDQSIRDDLHNARSDHELLEILTTVCTRVIKDGRNPSRLLSVGILSAVKDDPQRFGQPSVLKYLLRLLRSKHYVGMKDLSGGADIGLKKQSGLAGAVAVEMLEIPLSVLVANVLVQVMKDMNDWPVDSVKVFLDDSLYSRVWVDHELSQLFVSNVKTILIASDSPSGDPQGEIRRRFHGAQVFQEMRDLSINHIRSRLAEMEKEKTGANGGGGGSTAIRNMILTLIDFASIPQARTLAAENMETWLQNPSVKGPTKELLNKVVSLCKTTEQMDMYTVDVLLKMKLKSTMFQVKVETVSQLVRQNRAYLKLALSVYIARERPNNMGKDVDNMKMIQQIFRAARSAANAGSGDELFYKMPVIHQGAMASKELARVFRELSSTSDMAPVLKTIVRKILKQLTFEQVDIKSLCVGVLENEGHWDTVTKFGDTRLLDYMSLVTGVVWLILLMRGTAVKSLQIQQSNTVGRQGAGPSALGSTMKLSGSQPIPRRGILPIGAQRAPKIVSRDGKITPVSGGGKSKLAAAPVPGVASATSSATAASGPGATPPQTDTSKTVKPAVKAKEELLQTMAYVQREAVVCCRDIFKHFSLSGASSFEKLLYEGIVKKLLFLEIPADVQPTEHDKVCFLSTKEDIPIHEDTLEMLTSLYNSCPSIDRLEALRTIETMVFRAAEGQLSREQLWRNHEEDLENYVFQGGVIGVEMKSIAFIRELLMLTKVDTDLKLEQEFCHANRFWIICSILLIIGCFNPNTVGDYLWREFPTLRCLMQMVITGRYVFPPVNAQDPLLFGRHKASFSDLITGNLQLQDYEQQVLQHSQNPALFEDPPMMLEFDGIARQPPPAILEHLRSLDRKFKLGTRLRQSRASDFLMEMVTGNDAWSGESGSAESVWWIADIVCEDFDTVQYLPHGCLCKLLLLAYRGKSSSGSLNLNETKNAPLQPALSQIIPRLLSKLREYLAAENDTKGTASNVVLYYLDCLTSPDYHTRRVASQILQLLTAEPTEEDLLSTPGASDMDSVDDGDSHLDVDMKQPEESNAMSFKWLPALVKLPCYAGIRERVFWSLESILERESSVQSLTLCVKALHEFWKESTDADVKAEAKDDAAAKQLQQRKPALEQTLVLAGAFGKLLSSREFIAKHLLAQKEIYSIVLEVIWAVMKYQLAAPPSLKSKMGVSFSDCKVFYIADGSHTVREIKLPLHVIHGAIHVLCSPHACEEDGDTSANSDFSKLTQSLFPKATSSAAIISSTGLIATKDARLYPDPLLLKLAACSPSAHLCAAAVRAMKSEILWKLVLSAGLKEQCFGQVLHSLGILIPANEGKVIVGLGAATGKQDISDAAGVVLRHLSAFSGDGSCITLSRTTEESLRRVREWLASKVAAGLENDNSMDVDESEDELLLCKAFSLSSRLDKAPRASKSHVKSSLYTKMPTTTNDSQQGKAELAGARLSGSGTNKQLEIFKTHSFSDKEAKEVTSEKASREDSTVKKFVGTIEQGCPMCHASNSDTCTTKLWQQQFTLLHKLQSFTKSNDSSAQLAEVLVAIIGHISACKSPIHRKDCCKLLRHVLNNFQGSLSYAAAVAFVRGTVQVGTSDAFVKLADPLIAKDVHQALLEIVDFLSTLFAQWKAKGFELRLDALTLQSVVVLVKDIQILGGVAPALGTEVLAHLEQVHNDDDDGISMNLLTSFVKSQKDESILINVLDAVLSADPHFVMLNGVVALHSRVRREMLGALYFQNPLTVAPHLDTLLPGWELMVNLSTTSIPNHQHTASERRVIAFVDDMLRDLNQENLDVMDRFREILTRYPLLVLSRFPKQLLQLFGTLSLTQIYLNTALFQNILNAMDMVRPHLRSQPSLFATFCKFMFEILEVIATHQASEFHALVARMWDIFHDALAVDFDAASEQLFQAERQVVLLNIISIYAAFPEIRAFGEILENRHSESTIKTAMTALDAVRNKQLSSAEQHREVEQFVTQTQTRTLGAELVGSEADHVCQVIDQLCASSQDQSATMPLLRRCAAPLSTLFFAGNLTKATMNRLCHTLLSLMKADSASIPGTVDQYVQCLRSLRPGLKETAIAYVLEYLNFADNRQRRHILQQLFDDPSDIAKSKLVAYLKSNAFKSSLLPFARAVIVEQQGGVMLGNTV